VYNFFTVTIPGWWTEFIKLVKDFIKPVIDLFIKTAELWWNATKDFFKFIYDEVFIKFLAGATDKLAAVLGYVNGVINDVWAKTIANVFKNKNLTPEDTPAIAIDFILAATAAGVGAHLTSTIAEIWHPTHMIGLHYISGILGELASYSRIAAASVGVIVAIALRRPFEYYVNSLVRPTIPNERDLAELVVKRELKIDEYEKNMTYHGYSQRWIDCFKRAVFKEPRLTELSYVYEEGSIDDKWLLERIRRYGFSDDDADVFLKSMTTRVTKTQRLDFYNATMDLYSYGFISESQFKDNLATLDLRKEGKELAAKAATLKYLNAMIKEQITMYVSQYSKDILTAEQLRTALIGLGIDFMKVDVTVNKAVTAKTPKPTWDVSIKIDNEYQKLQQKMIPLYLQQYRLEIINQDTLRSSLIAAGAVPSYVDLIISVEKAKKVKTATKTSDVAIAAVERQIDNNYKTAYVQQFRDDYITADQLLSYLVQLGYDVDVAESIVAAESSKKYVAPSVTGEGTTEAINKELIKKYYDLYVLQYRKDLIDESQLEADLLSIGYDPQDVNVIIQTEYTRKQNPPKESTTALLPAVAT
jgi:transcription initiation factor IIF auxiliary subunit